MTTNHAAKTGVHNHPLGPCPDWCDATNDAAKRLRQAGFRLGSFAHGLTPTKTFKPEQTAEWDRLYAEALAAERRATLDDVRTAAHCLEVLIDEDVAAPEGELLFVALSQLEAYLDGRRVLHRYPDGSAILDAETER